MLAIVLASFSGFSALVSITVLARFGNAFKIDKATLLKMNKEREDAEAQREKTRAEIDEKRHLELREADEKRYAVQRTEIEQLTRTANDRFNQWQDAIRDLDELWQYVEDHVPWDREAMRLLRAANIAISTPPQLGKRHTRPSDDE